MKRRTVWSIFLSFLLLTAPLSGCQRPAPFAPDVPGDTTLSIVTTIFAPYDFVREIVGDKAQVTMLLPPAAEVHAYEPTAQDILKIQNAQLFVYVGGQSDAWVDRVLQSLDSPPDSTLTLMDCVEPLTAEVVEGMEAGIHDDDHDHDQEYDEHVWTSPRNAMLIVTRLLEALCTLDPANAALYRENASEYQNKLMDLDAVFMSVTTKGARQTIIFGDRFPFRYLTEAYGLTYYAAFPGCAEQSEPGAKTIAFLSDKVKQEQIPVIFHAELSNRKAANTIAEGTGAKVMELHACHGITKEDWESGVSYLQLMTQNAQNLWEALE